MQCCRVDKKRPAFWYWTGGICLALGVAMFIAAIVIRTAVFAAAIKGVYAMRYIDNTHEVDDCSHTYLGDMTCPGKRYEAWKMTTAEKQATCLHSESPGSLSRSAVSKWCDANGDAHCDKKKVCRPGQKFEYHFFSVLNPLDVMEDGAVAKIEQLEPIRIIRSVDKVEIHEKDLESNGTLSWKEAYAYTLLDPRDEPLLEQTIVLPNPAMFSTIIHGGSSNNPNRMTLDSLVYFTSAAQFYTTFQETINNLTRSLPQGELFAGRTAINFQTAVKDQYRSGRLTLAMGEFLASPACVDLLPLVASVLNSTLPKEIIIPLMCQPGFKNNIGMSAYSMVLSSSGLKVSPSNQMFFYEHEKGCDDPAKYEHRSKACYLAKVCPFEIGSAEYESCVKPSLSSREADLLFQLFDAINASIKAKKDDTTKFLILRFLGNNCEYKSTPVFEKSLCLKVTQQLLHVGRAAVLSMSTTFVKKLFASYGWDNSKTDQETGKSLIPYFVKMTIRDFMGFGHEKPLKDSVFKQTLGMGGKWINSLLSDGSTTRFLSPVLKQRVSSKFGEKGLNYFVSVANVHSAGVFDYGCMETNRFKQSGGIQAVPEQDKCMPVSVEGYDAGFFPSRLYGYGSEEYSAVGCSQKMLIPDFMMQSKFVLQKADNEWKHGLFVNEWSMDSFSANSHNCEKNIKSRGIDCDSPKNTANVGYQMALAMGDPYINPTSLMLPFFVSQPLFANNGVEQGGHQNKVGGIYDPKDKVQFVSGVSDADWVKHKSGSSFSKLLTEPETGAHVMGRVELQLNMRLTANLASKSRRPNSVPTGDVDNSKVSKIHPNTDLLVPLFRIAKYDQVEPFQALKLASLQSLPKTFNLVFGLLLGFGLLIIILGAVVIRAGCRAKTKMIVQQINSKTELKFRNSSSPSDLTDRAMSVTPTDLRNSSSSIANV